MLSMETRVSKCRVLKCRVSKSRVSRVEYRNSSIEMSSIKTRVSKSRVLKCQVSKPEYRNVKYRNSSIKKLSIKKSSIKKTSIKTWVSCVLTVTVFVAAKYLPTHWINFSMKRRWIIPQKDAEVSTVQQSTCNPFILQDFLSSKYDIFTMFFMIKIRFKIF